MAGLAGPVGQSRCAATEEHTIEEFRATCFPGLESLEHIGRVERRGSVLKKDDDKGNQRHARCRKGHCGYVLE